MLGSREMPMPRRPLRRRGEARRRSGPRGALASAPSSSRSASGRRVAEVDEAVAGEHAGIVAGPRTAIAGTPSVELAGDLLAQLDDHPLGGSLADPRARPGSASRRRLAIARRSSRGAPPERIAIATLGPTPETEIRCRKRSRSSSVAKPKSCIESSRETRWLWSSTSLPLDGHRLERLRGDAEPVADAGRLDDDVVGAADQHLAADRGDHPTPTLAWPAASIAGRRCVACPAWQIATASASAA